MDKIKFNAVLPIISADLVEKIAIKLNLSDEGAIEKLYSYQLYELLEKEETKLWQYSTEKLLDMFLEELHQGKINFPEI